jgi:hypothetical protein
MNQKIDSLSNALKKLPFPALGKVVGDFAFYDSLLAGAVTSFLRGASIDPHGIPGPDEQSAVKLALLKNKLKPNIPETEFLKYAELLEQLRSELIKEACGGKSQVSNSKSQAFG